MIETLKKVDGRFVCEDEISHETEAEYLFTRVLGFCGCGNPEENAAYVRRMFAKHASGDKCWEYTFYEDQEVMFFLQWATEKKFIEHGTTIRCSWLTPRGEELLRDLDTVLGP